MKTLLAVALIAVAVAGCGRPGQSEEGEEEKAVPVRVQAVELTTITASLTATGTIVARDDVSVGAETGGRVREVPVVVGDRIAAGDVLVVLDDELPALAVRQAEAQRLLAEADRDEAVANWERARALWEHEDISDAEYESAERIAKVARAGMMAAEAALGGAERQLRNTRIESPVDGLVAFVFAEVGQLVAVGTPVAHVVNDAILEIDVGLGEDRVVHVRPGQAATVQVRALPEEVFEGRVEYVGPRSDDATRTYPVRVLMRNRDGLLRSGMVGEVEIAADLLEDVIVVDRDWVVDRYGEPALLVASDSRAEIRKVKLGRIVGDRVLVLSGLEPGDLVVTLGYDQVTDGALLELAAESDTTEVSTR